MLPLNFPAYEFISEPVHDQFLQAESTSQNNSLADPTTEAQPKCPTDIGRHALVSRKASILTPDHRAQAPAVTPNVKEVDRKATGKYA